MSSPWVEAPNWKTRWESLKEIKGGGQGEAFKARRLEDSQPGFLKVIKSRKDLERRARFSREANAYHTIRVNGVPRLIESNAHLHDDLTVIPYIVTEFIEGSTLSEWRATQGQIELGPAVLMTRRLVEILDACHGQGVVHRDVKPDNIILLGNDIAQPHLLDFGLSYHDMPEIDFRTENYQEVGNRFLRLPELSAGSLSKQDPRSDIAFAAGILFYLLTGEHPDVLQDATGRMPHQRSGPLARLQAVAGARQSRLAGIFDHCFETRIEHRCSSAGVLRDRLDNLMAEPSATTSVDEDRKIIAEILDTPTEQRRNDAEAIIQRGLREIHDVFKRVNADLGPSLSLLQTNWSVNGDVGQNTLIWKRRDSKDDLLSITYELHALGDEIVLRIFGEDIHRTPLAAPAWDGFCSDEVYRRVLSNLREALTNPNALPPEAARFVERQPFGTITDAWAEAKRSGKNILAFVYDPAQAERGRLNHALGAFLRNRKTRDQMHGAFVIALVPLWQLSNISDILKDASMETSRWVVLDLDLNALEESVIYANAQEAERIMGDLVKRRGL